MSTLSGTRDYGRFDALAEEFADRFRRGERPSIQEYVDRLPEMAEEIREMFPALVEVERADGDVRDAPIAPPTHSALHLSQIGDYRILREVGRGGMGVVYEAEQVSLGRRVALKVLPSHVVGDRKTQERFLREAKSAARLHHTNIVPVYEVGRDGDVSFYAMQLIQGQGLEQVIDELTRLRQPKAKRDANGAAAGCPEPTSAGILTQEVDLTRPRRRELARAAESLLSGRFLTEGRDSSAVVVADSDLRMTEPISPESGRTPTVAILDPSASVSPHADFSSSAVLPGGTHVSEVDTSGRRQPFFRSVAQIGRQAAQGLAYAHARGIIHRDIKPSNLLLDTAGVVWITDFGLAKAEDDGLTATGDILGTLRYMPPERFRGEGDARADIYGLGVTLYELLTLRPAYGSSDRLKLIEKVKNDEPARPRSLDARIPRDLETIVLKSIDKDPQRRYQSADAMAEDLRRFLADEPIHARQISTSERYWRWARRNPVIAVLGALLTAVLTIGFAVMAVLWSRAEGSAEKAKRSERATAEALAKVASQKEQVESSLEKAEKAERVVRLSEEQGRRLLYATDMQLAPFIWNDSQATAAQLRGRLDAHDPRKNSSLAGKYDLRGFEWHYYSHLMENNSTVFHSANALITDFALSDDGRLITLDQSRAVKHWNVATHLEMTNSIPGLAGLLGQAIALSSDGQRVATAFGKTVQVKDAKSGAESLNFESQSAIKVLMFSEDGRFIVTHDGDNAQWFDAASGQLVAAWNVGKGRGLSLAADGLTLAVIGFTSSNVFASNIGSRIAIFGLDATTKKVAPQPRALDSLGGSISTAALSPDGKLIAVGSVLAGSLFVYDAATCQPIASHPSAHASAVSAIAFSRNGLDLATADGAGVIKTWGDARKLTSSSQPQLTLKGQSEATNKVAFSADGKKLLSASRDGTVRIWAMDHTLSAVRLLNSSQVDPVFFAGGLLIATAEGNRVTIWDASSGQRLQSLAEGGEILGIAISPDNRLLAVGRYLEDRFARPYRPSFLSLWEIDTGRRVAEFAGINGMEQHFAYCAIETLAFSPDGKFLVAGFGDRGSHFTSNLVDLKVWDVANLREHTRLNGHNNTCVSISFSADGSLLASGSHDGTARIWDAATWRSVGAPFSAGDPMTRDNSVEALAFAPDRRTLAMGTMDGKVLIWNVETRDRIELSKAHANGVLCIAFSPDGRTMASGSLDETIRLWNVATWRELMILNSKDLKLGQVRSLAFSADGKRLLAGGKAGAVVWSASPSVWDNPASEAIELEPLLRSDDEFRKQIRTLSELPRLHDSLEALKVFHPFDKRVQAALAATGANRQAARKQWREAVEELDRLLKLESGSPELWLQTPGLLRLADAVVQQKSTDQLSKLAPTSAASSAMLAQHLADQGKAELASAARIRARKLFEGQLAREPKNSILASELAELLLIDSPRVTGGPKTSESKKEHFAAKQLADPWAKLAAAYTLSGRSSESVQYFNQALEGADGYDAKKAIIEYAVQNDEFFTALVKRRPNSPQIQLALARRLIASGKTGLAGKKYAEALSELKRAEDIVTRLLARVADWTVLHPVDMKTSSGAKMELQKDGSIFVQRHEVADVYAVTFQTDLKEIRGVRLEVLADARLPSGGSGWNGDGNFVLSDLLIDSASAESPGQRRLVGLRNASADFSQKGWEVGKAADGDNGNGWSLSPESGKDHTAVFETAEKIGDGKATRIGVELVQNFPSRKHLLGRFRLSFTNDAATLEATRIRLDLKDVELAELYSAIGKAYAQEGQIGDALAAFTRGLELVKERDAKSRIIATTISLTGDENGNEEPPLADAAKLRRQALEWLKSELADSAKLLELDPPESRPAIVRAVEHLQQDSTLAGVREAQALGKLPEDEQKEWKTFWADVDSLLKRLPTQKGVETKLEPDDPEMLEGIHRRAHELAFFKPNEAEPLFRQALEGYRKTLGPESALTHDLTLDLANLLCMSSRWPEAEPLFREALEFARKRLQHGDPNLAGILAPFGLCLIQQGKWSEAEPLLRECLAIREKLHADEWTTFNTRSLLGGSLLGQKKFEEAEPLIISGYEGMKGREAKIPEQGAPRLNEAAERVIDLYEAWDKKDKAALWRAKLGRPSDELEPRS